MHEKTKIVDNQGNILAEMTTAHPASHYGQPVWVVHDPNPAPGDAQMHLDGSIVKLTIKGECGGWLVVEDAGHGLTGIIWSDGMYISDDIIDRITHERARRVSLEELQSGRYMVRRAISFPGAPLGATIV